MGEETDLPGQAEGLSDGEEGKGENLQQQLADLSRQVEGLSADLTASQEAEQGLRRTLVALEARVKDGEITVSTLQGEAGELQEALSQAKEDLAALNGKVLVSQEEKEKAQQDLKQVQAEKKALLKGFKSSDDARDRLAGELKKLEETYKEFASFAEGCMKQAEDDARKANKQVKRLEEAAGSVFTEVSRPPKSKKARKEESEQEAAQRLLQEFRKEPETPDPSPNGSRSDKAGGERVRP